jgi:hypothetical protein
VQHPYMLGTESRFGFWAILAASHCACATNRPTHSEIPAYVAPVEDEPMQPHSGCAFGAPTGAPEASIAEIASNRSRYEGQRIRVQGVGSMKIEATTVSSDEGSIWLRMASKSQMIKLSDCTGARITVEGVFSASIRGHWGGSMGGLDEISFVGLAAGPGRSENTMQ